MGEGEGRGCESSRGWNFRDCPLWDIHFHKIIFILVKNYLAAIAPGRAHNLITSFRVLFSTSLNSGEQVFLFSKCESRGRGTVQLAEALTLRSNFTKKRMSNFQSHIHLDEHTAFEKSMSLESEEKNELKFVQKELETCPNKNLKSQWLQS